MIVDIDKNSGFCFGVVYAIKTAEDILDENEYLYCLGDIVHNDEEVSRLKAKGLRIIDHEQLANIKNERVLIRAHGEPPSTYELAIKNNIELVDASCPVVLKLQHRVRKAFNKNEDIFIYGKPGHAEVIGLEGQTLNKAVVFLNPSEIKEEDLPAKITLFSQTTKSTKDYYEKAQAFRDRGVEVEFNDTICRQVSNRGPELELFAQRYNHVVFVAGKKSSNGKVLFEVCASKNPNTYFVSTEDELDLSLFKSSDTVGICGATSTPLWQMELVKDKLISVFS